VPPFLIVNADDFNLTEGVSRGILDAHRDGIVTSTTVMVNLPGLGRSRDLAREFPRLGLGLHLNLTFGPPILPPGRVPSLVDDGGRFVRDPARVRTAGAPAEIRAEWAAQAERFETIFGRRPTHLDSHHHVHRHPRILEMALDLAETLDVPLRALTPEMAQRIRASRLPAVDETVGDVGPEAFWQPARLVDFLRGLVGGVTELMCHPGYVDDALSASSYCAQREVELRSLCDPRAKDALAAAGARCITYGELAVVLASRH
jgi:predicted glycoside hydrolase/deacetylase ChbG (UPF0249 family)